MTPARAALQLHAVLAAMEGESIPVCGARVLSDGRWWVRVGPSPIVSAWLHAGHAFDSHPITRDAWGVRVWSKS